MKTVIFDKRSVEVFEGPRLGTFYGFLGANCFELAIGQMTSDDLDGLSLIEPISGIRFVKITSQDLIVVHFDLQKAALKAFNRQVALYGADRIIQTTLRAQHEFANR